ncbi:Crp/Fnr family transcriptional regulator [Flavobacterium sp.]|uniref:Crp/Fnr family transcriptional regulator n=1 Tax=Flavobacterium sp. TaxID=239 RepID=UPI003D0FDF6B
MNACKSILEIPSFEVIGKRCLVKKFKPGEYLVCQGDTSSYLPLITKGVVRLDCAKNEKDVLIDYVVSGEACVVSFSHIQVKSKVIFTALALTEVEAFLLPVSDLIEIIKLYPDFSAFVLEQVSVNFYDALNRYVDLQTNDLEKRLQAYMEKYKNKLEINGLRLTHQQIASDLGVSREAVTRAFAKISTL